MHIPDGYLSPATAAVMYAASAPFWYRASQKIKTVIAGRLVPRIALFAALAFVIMLFNIPAPGGTTAHAIGSVLAALVVGPWASVLAISVALIIQAFFFGDGGILALGANVFNMAIAMPFAGWFVYRALAGNTSNASRRILAAAIAGYVGANVAALLTGIELGLQAALFRDAAGRALYFPYGIEVAVPAMLLEHLTIAGVVEAFVTGGVLAWILRTNPEMIVESPGASSTVARMPQWAWALIALLVVLTPLGLLTPGSPWGEWGREELANLGLGYIPAGLDQWSNLWRAPIPDYDIPLLENPTIAYIVSALIGAGLVALATFAVLWIVRRVKAQPART
ncbi:MAG: cobalt transporter CbiM [Chloroflexi bacterium]|nr:cobalt transporter CbiM [Chloroflexota bacterium]